MVEEVGARLSVGGQAGREIGLSWRTAGARGHGPGPRQYCTLRCQLCEAEVDVYCRQLVGAWCKCGSPLTLLRQKAWASEETGGPSLRELELSWRSELAGAGAAVQP